MRDSFKWHFQAQFLERAYVIRHNCLHMFGCTISEMTSSPPEDVKRVSVEPPESECRPFLWGSLRKERYQRAEESDSFLSGFSSVIFHCACILARTCLHFPCVFLLHVCMQ